MHSAQTTPPPAVGREEPDFQTDLSWAGRLSAISWSTPVKPVAAPLLQHQQPQSISIVDDIGGRGRPKQQQHPARRPLHTASAIGPAWPVFATNFDTNAVFVARVRMFEQRSPTYT